MFTPFVRDLLGLQNDMLNTALAQAIAHRKPGLAASDYHDLMMSPVNKTRSHQPSPRSDMTPSRSEDLATL